MGPSGRLAALAAAGAIALAVSGCALERNGLAPPDGGEGGGDAGPDGDRPDGPRPDGSLPDAGPPDVGDYDAGCATFGPPSPLVTLDATGLRDPGASLDRVVVEDPGQLALELQPYRYGALLFHGFDTTLGETPALAELDGRTPTAAALHPHLDRSFGSGSPPELLLPSGDGYSVRAVGEIRLTAGSHEVELTVDDRGVVELDVGGGVQLRATTPGRAERMGFEVPADGWYPIRLAWTELIGDASYRVRIGPPGSLAVPAPERLRTAARREPGRDMIAFDAVPADDSPDGARIDATVSDASFGPGFPVGVGVTDGESWSMTWMGSVLFPAADPTLRVQSDGPHRLWVDGVFAGGDYVSSTYDDTYGLRAGPGWHDIVLQLDENLGNAYLLVTDPDATLPPERLRPVTRFGGTAFGAGTSPDLPVVSGTAQTTTLVVTAPGTGHVAVEVSALLEVPEPAATTIVIAGPDSVGRMFPIDDTTSVPMGGDLHHLRVVLRGTELPPVATGAWALGITNAGASTVRLVSWSVLVHTGGDDAPYAGRGLFISAPITLDGRYRPSSITAEAHALFGTGVALGVRAAEDLDTLALLPFAPAAADGTVAEHRAGRLVQISVELTGPGTDSPRVMRVDLAGGACTD